MQCSKKNNSKERPWRCKNEALIGHKFCEHHLRLEKKQYRTRRQRAQQSGKCVLCGKRPAKLPALTCSVCLRKTALRDIEKHAIRRKKKLCRECAMPLPHKYPYWRCVWCLQKGKEHKQ